MSDHQPPASVIHQETVLVLDPITLPTLKFLRKHRYRDTGLHVQRSPSSPQLIHLPCPIRAPESSSSHTEINGDHKPSSSKLVDRCGVVVGDRAPDDDQVLDFSITSDFAIRLEPRKRKCEEILDRTSRSIGTDWFNDRDLELDWAPDKGIEAIESNPARNVSEKMELDWSCVSASDAERHGMQRAVEYLEDLDHSGERGTLSSSTARVTRDDAKVAELLDF